MTGGRRTRDSGRGLSALAAVLAFAGLGCMSPGAATPSGAGPALEFGPNTRVPIPSDTILGSPDLLVYGEADYEWRLERLDGSTVSLSAFQGKVVFINMWATWCGPCIRELSSIEALINSMAGSEVSFLLVSPEEARSVARFLRIHDYDLPVYLEAQEMPSAFGLKALPTTFIVDKVGRIVLRHRGAANWDLDSVRQLLQALAASH